VCFVVLHSSKDHLETGTRDLDHPISHWCKKHRQEERERERDCGGGLGMRGEGIALFLYSERKVELGPSISPLSIYSDELLT
jgi:hypothetical protein